MVGSSYALLALGFTLIFGTMRRLNLAYGPTIMAGAYLGTYASLRLGRRRRSPSSSRGRRARRPLRRASLLPPLRRTAAITSMVSSFAVWMQIEEAATLLLPRHFNAFPALVAGRRSRGPVLLPAGSPADARGGARPPRLVYWRCTTPVSASACDRHRSSPRSRARRRAREADADAGIRPGFRHRRPGRLPDRGQRAQITPMFGMWATTKGLIAMMLGGLGSVPGAIVGGLALGIIEAHAQWRSGRRCVISLPGASCSRCSPSCPAG